MRKITTLFIFIGILLCTIHIIPSFTYAKENKYYYTTKVEHLFTQGLSAYPELAFNKNNSMSKHYDTDCITSNEFKNILTKLYNNNYVLTSINDCFQVNSNGIAEKKKIKVPTGKKPLILSFDDVNYDQKKLGKGMVDKIIVDDKGNLASSTVINGKSEISYNKEFVPILENFIKKNPSFSLNGAKGTLCLTGYDGILGYRTSHTNKINRNSEINKAKIVVNKLKENGWGFACHSYGHYHMNKISIDKFKNELNLWKDEVESIIGKTNVYVYPYGEWEVFDNGEISEKHKILIDNGFKLFCGVGMKTFYSYLPNKNNHKVLFMDRKCVDGRTLRANSTELHPFFNPLQILDDKRIK